MLKTIRLESFHEKARPPLTLPRTSEGVRVSECRIILLCDQSINQSINQQSINNLRIEIATKTTTVYNKFNKGSFGNWSLAIAHCTEHNAVTRSRLWAPEYIFYFMSPPLKQQFCPETFRRLCKESLPRDMKGFLSSGYFLFIFMALRYRFAIHKQNVQQQSVSNV